MKKRKIYKIEVTNNETQKSKIFEIEAYSRNQAEKLAVKFMQKEENNGITIMTSLKQFFNLKK